MREKAASYWDYTAAVIDELMTVGHWRIDTDKVNVK
jgi:hypothetical protein